MARFVKLAVGRGRSEGGVVEETIELKQVVQALADLIWAREERLQRPVEAAVLRYVQGAVAIELEYRRNMRDLNLLLAEVATPEEETASSRSAGDGL